MSVLTPKSDIGGGRRLVQCVPKRHSFDLGQGTARPSHRRWRSLEAGATWDVPRPGLRLGRGTPPNASSLANDMTSVSVVHEGARRLRDLGGLGGSDGSRREYGDDCQEDKTLFHSLSPTRGYEVRCAPQWPQLGFGTCTGVHAPPGFPSTHGLAEAMEGAAASAFSTVGPSASSHLAPAVLSGNTTPTFDSGSDRLVTEQARRTTPSAASAAIRHAALCMYLATPLAVTLSERG